MKIKNVKIYGLEHSIIASRYPMSINIPNDVDAIEKMLNNILSLPGSLSVNTEDELGYLKRAKLLGKTPVGSGHNCFSKGIIVQADITGPQYFWLQFERYHFQDTISSQSTMHRITKMNLQEQMNQYVDKRVISILQEYINLYNFDPSKENFQRIVSNIPEGIKLTRRITTNYLQLKTIYNQRNNHKLEEWRDIFCPWILSLPYFEEIMLGTK